MDGDACVEEKIGSGDAVDQVTKPATALHKYTKEELLYIKELPISNERPECLSEKYDSDGVWDPEKWRASLYPTSGRNSPMDSFKKDFLEDRVPLKRRIPDPRERLKEDDLDVILSPQRRSFGGGCQGNAAPAVHASRPISPLENKENESLRLGGTRRIGSGRIIAARAFEREARLEEKRERERDFKDKRFRRDRDFGDKRVFSERRRNDSYAEEEPEWFSAGPTSQSETIELIGFDDKILEDDRRSKSRRSRKRTESVKEVVCNGLPEEQEVNLRATADQEVPHPDVLTEQSTGDFDFNEFFNLEKTMPGLASMIEDVLGEGPVSASRFSQWFSSNLSPSGSHSSSLRSTPHEELEKLAGLEGLGTSSGQGPASYFTPIQSEGKEKVDILELLHKAKIDLKPLLSTLSVNKARLRESTHSGAVLSLEEVEGEMKGLKLGSQPNVQNVAPPKRGNGTPFMAEHLEEALTGGPSVRPRRRDTDMSAFNKLVSSMKPPSDQSVVSRTEAKMPPQQPKNIFQELLGGPARSRSPTLLGNLLGNSEVPAAPSTLHGLLHKPPSPPLFPQRALSPDYFNSRLQHSAVPQGLSVGPQPMTPEQFADVHRSVSPVSAAQQQMRALSMPVNHADLEALAFQQDLALHAHHQYQSGYNRLPQDTCFRNRPQRLNRSPGPGAHPAGRISPGNAVTSMLSPSFTPTSVIRKMYATKEKSKDDPSGRSEIKEEAAAQDGIEPFVGLQRFIFECLNVEVFKPFMTENSLNLHLDAMEGNNAQTGGMKSTSQSLASKDQERLRPLSAGHHTATTTLPGPSSTFPRPIYPVPLLSHVPMVRPPPQLHPNVVQQMLAQGIQPQQLAPTLVQGIYPHDLAQLQGLPPTMLGQPMYPLSATGGHPLLPPRANSQMQLAVMQQQLQQQRQMHPIISGLQSQSQGPHRTNGPQRHGRSPPPGLSKWFGSDVLDQQLPSMPAKVISVDELEFRP
ncbi:eukaryotic translation initiation factor 4E transporter isoform X2 [Entelurus aequoreus]|uniref:eukaryotic translation initiation factor 4E transporter isoform X2 n=1 Tax=Entelurus aequoreus TaxID=161455 RepID=UPI002B1D25C7|nr:eukaryotic translation initiation factor 4E transporter isoform X2 [Entelurus aequoreus]